MSALTFEINIDNIWHVLSPTYSDFKLKKSRDKEQIFVVQTISSGVLNFSCDDYVLLIPYVGQTLTGRLTGRS